MRSRALVLFVLVAFFVLAIGFAGQALAGGSVDGVIQDAQNGTIDKNWSASEVQAAITYLKGNPTASQYSDAQAVLEDYLASLGQNGAAGTGVMGAGELAFTGGDIWLILATGAGLVGGGLILRRRVRA
jgi:hypothetical protein